MTTEETIADLERRISVQEYLHRFADENGNIRHNMSIIPYLFVATFLGAGYTYWMVGDRTSTKGKIFLGLCVLLALGTIGFTFFLLSAPPAKMHQIDYSKAELAKENSEVK